MQSVLNSGREELRDLGLKEKTLKMKAWRMGFDLNRKTSKMKVWKRDIWKKQIEK